MANQHLKMVEASRNEALQKARDILTGYLVDQCPEGVDWEDFDPEVDNLRTAIDDIQ